ncbi:hypothetical protein Vadar_030721 [Vaccinium darrowii]|uniref:Uncharacterized protein n=1 Tax=Vaccinium darrowii TaxID=229202 RepID=A0ACB7YZU5_9ERIC|nr:hypothetical protein Vadar_030721 [Vaccinium darrowii]
MLLTSYYFLNIVVVLLVEPDGLALEFLEEQEELQELEAFLLSKTVELVNYKEILEKVVVEMRGQMRECMWAEFEAYNVLHPGLRVAILKALCDIRVEVNQLKRDLLPTMTSGVMYWPFYDFVTFKFIPVHLQPLVSNSFSYLWTVYLTYMASLEKASTSQ